MAPFENVAPLLPWYLGTYHGTYRSAEEPAGSLRYQGNLGSFGLLRRCCRTFYSCNPERRLNPSTSRLLHHRATTSPNLLLLYQSPPTTNDHHILPPCTADHCNSSCTYPTKGNTLEEVTAPAHVVASIQRASFLHSSHRADSQPNCRLASGLLPFLSGLNVLTPHPQIT